MTCLHTFFLTKNCIHTVPCIKAHRRHSLIMMLQFFGDDLLDELLVVDLLVIEGAARCEFRLGFFRCGQDCYRGCFRLFLVRLKV